MNSEKFWSESKGSEEIWVEVASYPRYLVSNYGRVMNRITNRILKPADNGSGYLYVTLYDLNGQHHCYVHRLVALGFLNCNNINLEVNHKDENGDKTNNHVSNLEWATREENIQHVFRNGLNSPTYRGNVRPVQIVETGEVFESAAACARAIGGRQSTIHRIVNGIGRSHMGYSFIYAD